MRCKIGGAENAGLENAGLKNAGPENAGLESDELKLKQPQTSSTTDVSELSQNCIGLLHEVVDVRVHFCSKVRRRRTTTYDPAHPTSYDVVPYAV